MAKRLLLDGINPKKRRKYGEGYNYKNNDFYSIRFTGSASQRLGKLMQNRFFVFFKNVSALLSNVSSKVYGAISITFGLLTTFMYFLGLSAGKGISSPIIGIIFTIFSIPFLLAEKPLPILFQDFRLTDYVFFEFFCMKRPIGVYQTAKFPIPVAVIIGVILASVGCFVPAWQIILAIGIMVFVYLSFASPEFTLLASFLLIPYFRYIPYSTTWFVLMIGVGMISFFRKAVFGKRVLHFETYDFMIAIFTLLILISGIFVKGMESFVVSVEMIILAMGYTLASNIITNRRLADCALNSIIISSVAPSIISIAQFSTIASSIGLRNVSVDDIASIFIKKNELAPFILVALVFSFAMAAQNKDFTRILYVAGITLNFIALLLTGEFFALFVILLSGLAYAALRTKRLPILVLPILFMVPYALLAIIPNAVLDGMFSLMPPIETVKHLGELWTSSISALSNNFFVGIGIGKDSFISEMVNYGVVGHNDSANLFIEIALEAGALALLSFIVLMLVRIWHRTKYFGYVKHSQTSIISKVSESCVFCLIAFGTVNYIWSDMSVYYLFWCVFGIGSAAMRVAKNEYDDRVDYYDDTRDIDFSEIDVQIG